MKTSRACAALTISTFAAVMTACGADGAGPQQQDPASADSGKAGRHACHYVVETFTECPDFNLPSEKKETCADDVDCESLKSDDSVIAGCLSSTLYLQKDSIAGTCADWRQGGGGGAHDASAPDAATWHWDGGTRDARAPDASVACAPNDLSQFAPMPHPATGAHQRKCSAADVEGFYEACLGPAATPQACGTVYYGACGTCLVSQWGDAKWGPLLTDSELTSINVGGCVALSSPGDATCSNIAQAAQECEKAACGHCSSASDSSRYAGCAALANARGCSAYAQASSCDAEEDGGAAASCFGSDFHTAFQAVALLFCGP